MTTDHRLPTDPAATAPRPTRAAATGPRWEPLGAGRRC